MPWLETNFASGFCLTTSPSKLSRWLVLIKDEWRLFFIAVKAYVSLTASFNSSPHAASRTRLMWPLTVTNVLSQPTVTVPAGPAGSPSSGGDVVAFVKDINQPSLPHSFLFCSCVCLWPFQLYFNFINSPDNSPLSHSVLPILILPHWSFQLYIALWKSPSALI